MASESEQEKHETLADIAAEIRAYGAQPPPRLMWLEIADRIEAAWKRERAEIEAQALSIGGIVESSRNKQKPQGNAAEMREEIVLRLSKKEYKGMQEALAEHDRLCEMVGNAAAMREALLEASHFVWASAQRTDRDLLVTGDEKRGPYVLSPKETFVKIDAALSAPARNCDKMPDIDNLTMHDLAKSPCKSTLEYASREELLALVRWLLAPAAERKGE